MMKYANHCLLTLRSHKPEVQNKYEMSIEKKKKKHGCCLLKNEYLTTTKPQNSCLLSH
ncbi:hypothetical protein NC651_006141 [Populus alba x Populus x berolinensis]|nr:hypothetical protein NC651_006141 [Populus alba x Populus x berolinensis]